MIPESRLMQQASFAGNARRLLCASAIAVACTVVVALPALLGATSPFGLAVLGLAGLAVSLSIGYRLPQLLILALPGLLPSPMFFYTFAWEVLLYAFAVLVIVQGVRTRARWLTSLTTPEILLLLYTGWGLISILWVASPHTYLIGARRDITGVVCLWVALRLAHLTSRRWFEWSLILCAGTVCVASLAHSLNVRVTAQNLDALRGSMTDLGWAKANYIATLLLALFPTLLEIALRRRTARSAAAWGAVIMIGIVQVVIASRGAMILFALAVLVQMGWLNRRRVVLGVAGGVAGLGALLATPYGIALMGRFVSARGLGSVAIRIWYWREAWRRTLEYWPIGMGLGQTWFPSDKLQGLDPHDFWLSVSGDHGLPGIALWVGLLVVLWRRIARARLVPAQADRALALLLGFALTQIHASIESTFNGTQYLFVFFWLVGGSIAMFEAEDAESSSA